MQVVVEPCLLDLGVVMWHGVVLFGGEFDQQRQASSHFDHDSRQPMMKSLLAIALILFASSTPCAESADSSKTPGSQLVITGVAEVILYGQDGYCGPMADYDKENKTGIVVAGGKRTWIHLKHGPCFGDFSFVPEPGRAYIFRAGAPNASCVVDLNRINPGKDPTPVNLRPEEKRVCLLPWNHGDVAAAEPPASAPRLATQEEHNASAPRLATKEEHKACRIDQEALDSRKTKLSASVERVTAAAAQLQAESTTYMTAWQRKGLKTPADVREYNAAVARFNSRGQELQRQLSEVLKDQTSFNAKVLEVNDRCAGQYVAQDVADEVAREMKRREGQ